MSSSTVTLKYLLLAEADKASKNLKSYGSQVDDTGKKVGGMSTKSKVALAAVGVAAVGFANASINKFKQVTVESRGIQRALGGTLEEASRFREAAILAGVDAGTFTKSAQKLDKTLVGAAKNTKTAAAMTKLLGFNFLDAHGKVKPMGDLLPKIADKIKSMPDGAEKTALAMQLFGKAGNSMLPFLGKGSEGIAELEKQSDKFGTTLNDGAIDALSKSKEQSRQWTAAMDGLKVQIGAQLLPIMNKLIGILQQYILPIFAKVSGFVRQHQQLVGFLAVAIGAIVIAVKAWAIAQKLLNFVFKEGALTAGGWITIIVLIAAALIYAYQHSETFRKIVQAAFHAVAAAGLFMWNNVLKPTFTALKAAWHVVADVFSAVASVIAGVFDFVKKHWGLLLAPLTGGFSLLIQHWRDVKNAFQTIGGGIGRAFDWVKDKVGKVIGWIVGKIKDVIGAIQTAIDKVNEFLGLTGSNNIGGSVLDNILNPQGGTAGPHKNHRASGGNVRAGMPYIVHDSPHAEIFVPGSDGYIFPRVSMDNGEASSKVDLSPVVDELRELRRDMQSMEVRMDGYLVGRVEGRQADRLGRAG